MVSAMAKIKLHNILHSSDRVLIAMRFQPEKAEFLPSIFYALREEGLSIPFTVQTIDLRGFFIFSLIIDPQNVDWAQAAFQEGLDLSPPGSMETRKDVVLTTLYGPHLGENPGIVSRLLSSMGAHGVKILALSASINSCLLVIPQESFSKSLRSLDRVFEIPSK
jgi:aspartokinase